MSRKTPRAAPLTAAWPWREDEVWVDDRWRGMVPAGAEVVTAWIAGGTAPPRNVLLVWDPADATFRLVTGPFQTGHWGHDGGVSPLASDEVAAMADGRADWVPPHHRERIAAFLRRRARG